MQRTAGFFLIFAAVLAGASLLIPPMNEVGLAIDLDQQLAAIEAEIDGWYTAQGLFAAGVLFAAMGLVFFATHVLGLEVGFLAKFLAFVGGVAALAAAVSWAMLVFDRFGTLLRIREALAAPDPIVSMVFGYTLLGALVLLSLVMFRSGYPAWFGWLVFVSSAALLGLFAYDLAWDPLWAFAPMALMGVGVFFAQPARMRRPRPV